ncbi:MAG: efflux RND transporter periplasmic adaptor subunit [Thermodesulfobacteriales bacterium]|nr:MAG: efflux RND transporter periplasmic adaptor subunit [Thermodesulfobacteriales bacterium]
MNNLIIIVLLSLLMVSCKDSGDIDIQRPLITGVTIAEINPTEVDVYYKTSGTVMAKTISEIASRVMGTVTSIEVKEGDRVAEGELLLTIDDRDIVHKVRAAEQGYKELSKALEAAKQNKHLLNLTYERYKSLYDEKALSEQEMDEIETKKKVADIEFERAQSALERGKATFREVQINLDFTRIKSPISGIVTEKNIEIGNTAVPGIPLLKVEDNSSFRLEVMVDEQLLEKLQVGMPANVYINALNRNVTGQISEIVPVIDPVTRTFLIKIDLNNEELLRTGLYAKALISYGKREAILVPEDAIVEKGQLDGVYTVDDEGIVNYRLIRAGTSFSGGVEVLSGLKEGDRIIVGGIQKVIDGGIFKNK